MCSWFHKEEPARPKSEADALLALSDTDFANVFVRAIREVIPAGHAMIVVAFENMAPMLAVLRSEAQRKGQVFNVDELIRESFERLNSSKDDEIKVRRWGWFSFSLQLHRLMQMAAANHSLRGRVVEIWALLASSGKYLKLTLESARHRGAVSTTGVGKNPPTSCRIRSIGSGKQRTLSAIAGLHQAPFGLTTSHLLRS
jgi:hypothetical protein